MGTIKSKIISMIIAAALLLSLFLGVTFSGATQIAFAEEITYVAQVAYEDIDVGFDMTDVIYQVSTDGEVTVYQFANLQDAINAVDNDQTTVKLIGDVYSAVQFLIQSGDNIILDMNGFDIHVVLTEAKGVSSDNAIRIESGAALEIANSSEERVYISASYDDVVTSTGTLTVVRIEDDMKVTGDNITFQCIATNAATAVQRVLVVTSGSGAETIISGEGIQLIAKNAITLNISILVNNTSTMYIENDIICVGVYSIDSNSILQVKGGYYSLSPSSYLADGYDCFQVTSGEYEDMWLAYESDGVVALSSDFYYSTVQGAIDSIDNDTIVLLSNVEEDLTIDENQTVTIDLNGYIITGNINSSGELFLVDSSGDDSGIIDGSVTAVAGNIYISSGTYNKKFTEEDGNIEITGGLFVYNPSDYVKYGYSATWLNEEAKFTINEYRIAVIDGESILTLDEFNTTVSALSEATTITLLTDFEVSGDSIIIPSGKNIVIDLAGNNIIADDIAIVNNGTLYITNSGEEAAVNGGITNYGSLQLSGATLAVSKDIIGGSIEIYDGFYDIEIDGEIKIYGGIFKEDMTEYLDEDSEVIADMYVQTDEGIGSYFLVYSNKVAYVQGNTYGYIIFDDLQKAIASIATTDDCSADNATEVVLLSDVALDSLAYSNSTYTLFGYLYVESGKSCILNLNGFDITVELEDKEIYSSNSINISIIYTESSSYLAIENNSGEFSQIIGGLTEEAEESEDFDYAQFNVIFAFGSVDVPGDKINFIIDGGTTAGITRVFTPNLTGVYNYITGSEITFKATLDSSNSTARGISTNGGYTYILSDDIKIIAENYANDAQAYAISRYAGIVYMYGGYYVGNLSNSTYIQVHQGYYESEWGSSNLNSGSVLDESYQSEIITFDGVEYTFEYKAYMVSAKIGDVTYVNIQDAIDSSSSDDTISMLRDSVDVNDGVILSIASDDDVIIDLNGWTLSNQIQISTGGELAIKNSSATQVMLPDVECEGYITSWCYQSNDAWIEFDYKEEAMVKNTLYELVISCETPTVTTAMQDIKVLQGEDVSLDATATVEDGGEVTYQWYSSIDEFIDDNDALIDGQISSRYQPSTQEGGNTYYYCKITNTKGYYQTVLISDIVKVEVVEKYAITLKDGETETVVYTNIDKTIDNLPTYESYTAESTTYYFVGWFDTDGNQVFASRIYDEDCTLNAEWTVNYVLSFDSNGGTETVSQSTTGAITQPSNPTRTGYEFVGWYQDAAFETVFDFDSVINSSITLYARWNAETYIITYELNGSVNATVNVETYTINSDKIIFEEPTKAGYVFDGWYIDSEYTTEILSIESGETGTVTLYAKWSLETYIITYELNGSVNATENVEEYTINSEEIIFGYPTDKEGYVFDGWYTDSEYQTKVESLASGSSGDITLYANWIFVIDETNVEVSGLSAQYLTAGLAEYSTITVVVDGVTLEKDVDYTIAFTESETSSFITITGQGGYSGYFEKSYTIICTSITDVETGEEEMYASAAIVQFYSYDDTAESIARVVIETESEDKFIEVSSEANVEYLFITNEITETDATSIENQESLAGYTISQDDVYTIKVTTDTNVVISGAAVTITIPYTCIDGITYEIAHLNSNGEFELLQTTQNELGTTLTFTTTEFSSFQIVYIEPETSESEASSSSSTGITLSSKYTVGGSSSYDADVEDEAEEEIPVATEAPTATETPTATVAPSATTAPTESGSSASNGYIIWIILGVVAIGAIGFVVYKKKKQ